MIALRSLSSMKGHCSISSNVRPQPMHFPACTWQMLTHGVSIRQLILFVQARLEIGEWLMSRRRLGDRVTAVESRTRECSFSWQ
jgi:hypothetical protein